MHKIMRQQRGKERRCAADYANVGGLCIGQGDVFQKVVEADAAEACCHKNRLLLFICFQHFRIGQPKGEKGHNKAEKKDFQRLKAGK